MSDWIVSLIRTYVPLAVGVVVSWLARNNIVAIDGESAAAVFTAAVVGLYYAAARLLEKRWPKAGWLLGAAKSPSYAKEG